MLGHDGDAAECARRTDRPRVLLITLDRVAEQMAGPAIRCWELGHLLSEYADVTLAAAELDPIASDRIELVAFTLHSPRALRELIAQADVIIAQPQWSVIADWMHRSRARVIYDLYDPETLETLAAGGKLSPVFRYVWREMTLDRLQDALRGGHHFICASEKQRDLWLGAMYGQRLIGPVAYDRDPSFRSVIDLVPFGLPPQPPPPRRGPSVIRARFPAIGADDEIVLWNGGIWNWLDPACAVRAFVHLRKRRPRTRLVFMGAGTMPAAIDATTKARQAAIDAGLLDSHVFFNDSWVAYNERSNWLQDADCAVGTHLDHLETRYAFRTRLLDCFWAGLPPVCTAGDDLSDRVHRDGLGEAVAPGDDLALAAALERVLDRGRAAYGPALREAAAEYSWPRVGRPLVEFVMDARPSGPLGGRTRGPWRRDSAHQARFMAYKLSHHRLHKINQARVGLQRRRRPRTSCAATLRLIPATTSPKIAQLKTRAYYFGLLLSRRNSRFVTSYLKGLKGIEIGASAHNRYWLDAINVDKWSGTDTIYKREERRLAMRAAKVDVVAPGDDLPFEDDSHDFVFSSHVIEHFPDPIRALLEWQRVARRYVVAVVPHKERTFDADRPVTSVEELVERHRTGFRSEEDAHWTVWTCESFVEMCERLGFRVVDHLDPDDKVGNGFAVVLDASVKPPPIT